jgi:hypothetical protein
MRSIIDSQGAPHMWAIAILAVVAFVVDLVIHIASFVCIDPRGWIQPEWLEVVIFYAMFAAVMVPAIIVESRREKRAQSEGRVLPTESPRWFKPVMWVLVGYILFNFVVGGFRGIRPGEPVRQPDGTYAVDPGHGHPVVPISEDEYHRIRRLRVRALSGVFLGFYAAIASDLVFTLTGQKRFKSSEQTVRGISLVLSRRRRFGGGDSARE